MTSPEPLARPVFVVCAATGADLDDLVALESAAFAHDRASRRAIRHAIASPSITYLVARDASGLAGAAIVERRRGSRVARLASIAVAPASLGRGVGGELLAAAEADVLSRGCRRLRLEVRGGNRAAIRLYESRGYRRFAVVRGYYEDGAAAWRYEKDLATAAPSR